MSAKSDLEKDSHSHSVCQGQIQAAHEAPNMYALVTPKGCLIVGAIPNNETWLSPAPTLGGRESLSQSPADTKPKVPAPDRTILKHIDLSGCASWYLEDCKEAAELLSEFADMFSQHDLELGETSVVEHENKLGPNSWPFHESYGPIPQSMFEEV